MRAAGDRPAPHSRRSSPRGRPTVGLLGHGTRRRRLRLTGMRARLFIGFAAVGVITAVIVTGASYFLARQALINRVEQNAATQYQDYVESAGQALSQSDAIQPDLSYWHALAKNGDVIVIVTGQGTFPTDSEFGNVQPSAQFLAATANSLVQERTVVNGVPYVLTGAQIQPSGSHLYVYTSLAPIQETLTALIWVGATSTGIALLGALGVAFLATRNVLNPLRRLGAAARRLGQGDLDVQLEVTGNDEITDVSRTFNETARALAKSMEELRALEAASRRFVADVSHELRTPLTAMTAVTEVLEDFDNSDPTMNSAAHLIANETKRLARLVEDLMEISRMDAGTAGLRVEDINLPELVEATLATRGWTGQCVVSAPEFLVARVDARRIDVVVANLVGNALKHGGAPVGLTMYNQGSMIIVDVADSGPGVPEEALPYIFDRFYKADKARGRSEGSGLGLAIAFENARLHDGELSARNRPDGGAVFTLSFPRILPEPADLDIEQEEVGV
jgi:two-component system, OmpR family, sensor histidine kinase MtrB